MLTAAGSTISTTICGAPKNFGFTPRRCGHSSRHVQHAADLHRPRVAPRVARGAVGAARGIPRRLGALRIHARRGAEAGEDDADADRARPSRRPTSPPSSPATPFPARRSSSGARASPRPALAAIIVNNKISNVCAPGGVAAAERICAEAGAPPRLRAGRGPARARPASSAGAFPVDAIAGRAAGRRGRARGRLDPARGRGDRDHRPLPQGPARRRRRRLDRRDRQGRGDDRAQPGHHAGLPPDRPRGPGASSCAGCWPTAVEPDLQLDQRRQRHQHLGHGGPASPPAASPARTRARSSAPCAPCARDLAEDVVRNGEGVRHVIRVAVSNAPDCRVGPRARQGGRQRPPLQVRGGRQRPQRRPAGPGHRQARGRPGRARPTSPGCASRWAGSRSSPAGSFRLDPEKESALVAPPARGRALRQRAAEGRRLRGPPSTSPPTSAASRSRSTSAARAARRPSVLGADLTHEYVSENADYRS